MQKNTSQFTGSREAADPSADLFIKILKRIERERRLQLIKKLVLVSFSFVVSVGLGGMVWRSLMAELVRSGFLSYLSLAYYDLSLIEAHWHEFTLSLLESLPALTLSGFLILLLSALLSLRFLVRYLNLVWSLKHAK